MEDGIGLRSTFATQNQTQTVLRITHAHKERIKFPQDVTRGNKCTTVLDILSALIHRQPSPMMPNLFRSGIKVTGDDVKMITITNPLSLALPLPPLSLLSLSLLHSRSHICCQNRTRGLHIILVYAFGLDLKNHSCSHTITSLR